jgi:enoyl-CoA hydratase/carnithine racemase
LLAELECARHGAVLTVRLNRAEKKNALTDAMYRDIATALTDADQDPAVAAVVLEGAGADFCAGNDIATLQALACGEVGLGDLHTTEFLGALNSFRKPLLAGVTGRAIGIGATMLLHCDVVLVAKDARLSFPFVDMALVPEAGSAYLLPARIGYARAYALLCLSDPISGEDAAAIGLVTASFPAAEIGSRIAAVAARLVAKSGTALRETKTLMRDREAISAAMQDDQKAFLARFRDTDVMELLRGFKKKTL